MSRKRDEYDAIWGGGPLPENGELFDQHGLSPTDALYGEVYSEVYDEAGDIVICDVCGDEIKWREKDGVYMCRRCGRTFTRKEFFDYIGAEPPGEECYTCECLYPGCMICPYGHGEL